MESYFVTVPQPLNPAWLAKQLVRYPNVTCWWVAYSGGLDSHVLLHCLASLPSLPGGATLKAVYVNHGLSPFAKDWAQHCREVCQKLGVSVRVLSVDVRQDRGGSPEAEAREARYRVFRSLLSQRVGLLTAHHQDDQAETLLLMLLRGSGLPGLAAMPELATLGTGPVGRPLLTTTRAIIRTYAKSHNLCWVEDESNQSLAFDRNYLRHQIIPILRHRWPALSQTLTRSAKHCGIAQDILSSVAKEDLSSAYLPGDRLSIASLLALDAGRQINLLRYWIGERGFLPPSTQQLARIQKEVVQARSDRSPVVAWAGTEIRRFQQALYVMLPVPPPPADNRWSWNLKKPLQLPSGAGVLKTVRHQGITPGLRRVGCTEIRFRQGGEQCLLPGRGSHSLKKLLQERKVPPWWRGHVPLVYMAGQLAAVADWWICEPFLTEPGESALQLQWEAPWKKGRDYSVPKVVVP